MSSSGGSSGGGGTPSGTVVGPGTLAQASAPGTASTFSRGDHFHGLPAGGTFTSELQVPDLAVAGIGGSATLSRFVGFTASGAPTSGTYNANDWIVDGTGKVYVCTAAGTPGTWTSASGGGITVVESGFLSGTIQLAPGTTTAVFTTGQLAVGTYNAKFTAHLSIGATQTAQVTGLALIQPAATNPGVATYNGGANQAVGRWNSETSTVIVGTLQEMTVDVVLDVTTAGAFECAVYASFSGSGTAVYGSADCYTSYSITQ